MDFIITCALCSVLRKRFMSYRIRDREAGAGGMSVGVPPWSCAVSGGARLHVYLYRGVRNAAAVQRGVAGGGWRCAVVQPRLVLSPLQLAVAANRAAVAGPARVTRSLYSELVYNLSLSKNISQSLSKFGIADDEDMLLCFLTTDDEDSRQEILPQVEGEARPLSELASLTDLDELKAAYKLNKLALNSHDELLDIIVSRMVTKNFVSH